MTSVLALCSQPLPVQDPLGWGFGGWKVEFAVEICGESLFAVATHRCSL